VSWHRFVILGDRRSAAHQLITPRTMFFGYYAVFVGIPEITYGLVVEEIMTKGESFFSTYAYSIIIFSYTSFIVYVILIRFHLLFPAIAFDRPFRL
jgi:hypothetical protein